MRAGLYISIADDSSRVRLMRLAALSGNLEDLHPNANDSCGVDGPARAANFGVPSHLALRPDGTLGFAASENIFNVDSDGIFRRDVRSGAERIAWSPSGELATASYENLRLEGTNDEGEPKLYTIAGNGTDRSDNIDADSALVGRVADLIWTDDNTLVFADEPEQRIRRLRRTGETWTVDTLAGSGTPDPLAGAGPALTQALYFPFDLAPLADGTIYFSQREDPRLHRLTPAGEREVVTTMPAPITAIAALPSGSLFVALANRHVVALIADESGAIATGATPVPVIGNGIDNWREGPADKVPLGEVRHLAATTSGELFASGGKPSQMIFRLRRTVTP